MSEGSTLVEIDPKDYEVALAKAQATLEASEAAPKSSNLDVPVSSVNTASQLKFASSDIKNAEAVIQAAERHAAAAHAHVLEAQAENIKAQDDVNRYHLLLAKEEVPKQIYDHAYAAAATDVAAIAAAEADEAAAQQTVQEAYSRLTEAQARYEDAQAGPQRVGVAHPAFPQFIHGLANQSIAKTALLTANINHASVSSTWSRQSQPGGPVG